MYKNTAVLRATITLGKDTYRIVALGKFSAGYDDTLVLQRKTTDLLGEPAWTTVTEARGGTDNTTHMLLSLIAAGVRS